MSFTDEFERAEVLGVRPIPPVLTPSERAGVKVTLWSLLDQLEPGKAQRVGMAPDVETLEGLRKLLAWLENGGGR